MKIRQTVRKVTKETWGLKVRAKRESSMDLVIIFRGVDGEPKRRFAPSKERVTEREEVGEDK